jgi:hypothetical protein
MWFSDQSSVAIHQFYVEFFRQFVVFFGIAAGADAVPTAPNL